MAGKKGMQGKPRTTGYETAVSVNERNFAYISSVERSIRIADPKKFESLIRYLDSPEVCRKFGIVFVEM